MAIEPILDAQAIEQLLAEARADLLRWCISLVGNRDSAEDLVQETLSIAWQSTHRPTQKGEFRAWLMGVARNVCLMWLRSQRRELAHRLDWPQVSPPTHPTARSFEPADPLDLDILLEQEELAQLVEKGLAVLPDATRRVLIAKYIEEYSLAEIAERLLITPEAVAARLHRGKHTLRRVLLMASPEDRALYGVLPTEATGPNSLYLCPASPRQSLRRVQTSNSVISRLFSVALFTNMMRCSRSCPPKTPGG